MANGTNLTALSGTVIISSRSEGKMEVFLNTVLGTLQKGSCARSSCDRRN